ncbi:MAG: hypothetical protein KAU58_00170, partial [Candidatus Omnitrophica bacterium]|nr:hypothetical protein [Candidatus Omnitrophota bacterium]
MSLDELAAKISAVQANGDSVEINYSYYSYINYNTDSGYSFSNNYGEIYFSPVVSDVAIVGQIEGANAADRTITISGLQLYMPEEVDIVLDDAAVTFEELINALEISNIATGSSETTTTKDLPIRKIDGIWTPRFTCTRFHTTTLLAETCNEVSGVITSVDTVNGTIFVDYFGINLPQNYVLSIDGQNITLAELESYVVSNETLGALTWLCDSSMQYTGAAWVFTGDVEAKIAIITKNNTQWVRGVINDVNTVNNTLTIGEKIIKLPDSYTIKLDNDSLTLAEFASAYAANTDNGVFTRVDDAYIKYLDGEWTFTLDSDWMFPTVTDEVMIEARAQNASLYIYPAVLENVDTVNNILTVEGFNIQVSPEDSFWVDGDKCNISELAAKLADNNSYGALTQTSYVLIHNSYSGGWALDYIASFATKKNSQSQYTGVVEAVDAISGTITANGMTIKIPDGLPVRLDGVEVTFAELETAMTLNNNTGAVTCLNGVSISKIKDDWVCRSSAVTLVSRKIGIEKLSSKVEAINTIAKTITVRGMTIHVPTEQVYLDGVCLTLNEFEALWNDNEAMGGHIWVNEEYVRYTSEGWVFTGSKIDFCVNGATYAGFEGDLTDVDTVNSILTIDGLAIRLPSWYSILVDGVNVTLSGLADILTSNNSAGILTKLKTEKYGTYSRIRYTASGGWEFIYKYSRVLFSAKYGTMYLSEGKLTDVDTVNKTLTVNGATVCVPDNVAILVDGNPVNLNELADIFTNNNNMGIMTWLTANSNRKLRYTTDGWVVSDPNMRFISRKEIIVNKLGGNLTDVDTVNNTLIINNITINADDNVEMTIDGETVTLEDMPDRLTAINSAGASIWLDPNSPGMKYAEIGYTQNGWEIFHTYYYNPTSSYYTNYPITLDFVTRKSNQTNFEGALSGVDTVNGTVTVDGLTVTVPDNLVIQADGMTVTLTELANLLTSNNNIDAVTWLTNGSVECHGNEWIFNAAALNFNTKKCVQNAITGALTDIDTVNKTVVINGLTVRLPDGLYILVDGKTVTFEELEGIVADYNSIDGRIWLTPSPSSTGIKFTGNGWIYTAKYLNLIADDRGISMTMNKSAVTGISSETYPNYRLIFIEGMNVRITDETRFTDGSSDMDSFVNTLQSNIDAGFRNLVSGTLSRYGGSVDWITDEIGIVNRQYSEGAIEFKGIVSDRTSITIDELDPTLGRLNKGGNEYVINNITEIRDIEGNVLTLAELKAIIDAPGSQSYMDIFVKKQSDVYYVVSVDIKLDARQFFAAEGKIKNVDLVNNEVTINGHTIKINESTTIKDSTGAIIDPNRLEEIVAQNAADSINTFAKSYNSLEIDGTICSSEITLFGELTKCVAGNIAAVDTANNTIIFEGVTYELADTVQIIDAFKQKITLQDLADIYSLFLAKSFQILCKIEMMRIDAGWKINKIELRNSFRENLIKGSSRITSYISGEIAINETEDYFTLGGIQFNNSATLEIKDATGVDIAWNDLENIFINNASNNIPTYVKVTLSNEITWQAAKVELTTGVSASIRGKLTDVNVSANTIKVVDKTINTSSAAIKLNDDTQLTMQELFNLINGNPDYLVNGIDAELKTITVNGITYTLDPAVTILDPDGRFISWEVLRFIFEYDTEAGISTYAKITADGTTATKIELQEKREYAFVSIIADKTAGEWIAEEVALEEVFCCIPAQIDFFSSTEPFVTIHGSKVVLDNNTVLTDETDPLNPTTISIDTLAQALSGQDAVYFAANIKEGENAAESGAIIYGKTRVMDGITRETIISHVADWLNNVSDKIQEAIDNILDWLGTQSEHFGISAFDALAFFINPIIPITDFAYMAAQAIIKDIEA